MGVEGLALSAVAGCALLIAALERAFPYDAGRPLFRRGLGMDVGLYAIAQSAVLGVVIAEFVRLVEARTAWSAAGLLTPWPIAGQLLLFVVTHDLYIYWFHRLQHASGALWRLHEVHHSTRELDWAAGARSHALEILINQTVEFAPMVLLGASPETIALKGAVSAVWGMWIHANVDVRTGRLQWLVNGPEAHRWHHATDLDARSRNFATKLALWDRLFGTAWIPAQRRPAGYGLDAPFPETYAGQQLAAFRPAREATAA